MKFFSKAFLVYAVLVLSACGGGGDDEDNANSVRTPSNTSQDAIGGEAVLDEQVMILSDGDIMSIVSETEEAITFNGVVTLTKGDIFLTSNGVYEAKEINQVGGQTIVEVGEPSVDDVFKTLKIDGTSNVTGAQVVESSALVQSIRPQASVGKDIEIPISFNSGVLSGQGASKNSFVVDVQYDYNSEEGGLKSAFFEVKQKSDTSINLGINVGSSFTSNIPLTKIRIPVPISVVDAALNTVGVRVASIYIPVSLYISGSSEISSEVEINLVAESASQISYVQGQSPSSNESLDGSISFQNPKMISNGEPIGASLTGNIGAYLRVRPALAFLNTVALLGADIKVGPDFVLTGLVTGEADPPYCLTGSGYLKGNIHGFFKGVNYSALNTPTYSRNIDGFEVGELGSCNRDVVVDLSVATSPVEYWNSLNIDVTVQAAEQSPESSAIPTGSVKVVMGSQECEISVLDSQSKGSCSLPANPASNSSLVIASYSGDMDFNPGSANATVEVERAMSEVTLNTDPPNPVTKSQTTFEVTVSDASENALPEQPAPVGVVAIVDGSNKICDIDLQTSGPGESKGSCNSIFEEGGNFNVVAKYQGDDRFRESEKAVEIEVVPAGVNITGASCVRTMDSGENGYEGPVYSVSFDGEVIGGPGDVLYTTIVVGSSCIGCDGPGAVLSINPWKTLDNYDSSAPVSGVSGKAIYSNDSKADFTYSATLSMNSNPQFATIPTAVEAYLFIGNNELRLDTRSLNCN